VYGNQQFYDPVTEYAIPESIGRKMVFTGYIPRRVPAASQINKVRKEQGLKASEKLVVVTAGGGGDGYRVMDAYLGMLENVPGEIPFRNVFITGPFMPVQKRKKIFKRARKLGVRTYHFYRHMEKLLAAADVVVSMGGYNTICELLSLGTVSIIIPRELPRKEQLIRAKLLHRRSLVEFIPWHACTPQQMQAKVYGLLDNPDACREAISRFQMTAIDVMRQRLAAFRNGEITNDCEPVLLAQQL